MTPAPTAGYAPNKVAKWNRVVAAAVLLNGLAIVSVPFAASLPQLVAASFANGLAIGVIEPMLNVGCVRLWPPRRAAPLMQVIIASSALSIPIVFRQLSAAPPAQTFATTFGAGRLPPRAIASLSVGAAPYGLRGESRVG